MGEKDSTERGQERLVPPRIINSVQKEIGFVIVAGVANEQSDFSIHRHMVVRLGGDMM